MQLPKTKSVEWGDLTTAIKAVVPSLEGLVEHDTTLEVRRLSGAFSTAEEAAIRQVFAAHDAIAIQAARKAKQLKIETERAKDPKTLSDKDRLTRLEIIQGVD